MADTTGSGSGAGGFFGSLLSDVTQVGMSYAAARGLDVNSAHPETVPGVESLYYGYNGQGQPPPASSGSSGVMTIAIIGGLALLAFIVIKKAL